MNAHTVKVTRRTWELDFPNRAPRITGVTSGLLDVTIEPTGAVITTYTRATYKVQLTGYKVLKSGGLAKWGDTVITVTTDPNRTIYRHPAPDWLVEVIERVTRS